MIDVSELAAVPVLSGAPEEDLARVARTAADIRLAPGENAAHEGDDRALFVVLAGKIEVTKAIDGIERTIGWRSPGQVFGEVPIIFGIPFQGSFRAHEPSRVIRIDPAQFHTLAARFPDALTRVASLARERIGGLQGIAAAPVRSRATLLGRRGDPASRELHSFLTRNQIRFDWLNPDSADASRWPGTTAGAEDLPALHCEDGTTLLRARPRQVAERLGLPTLPRGTEYD